MESSNLPIDDMLDQTTRLRQSFAATAPRSWTPLIAGVELAIQLGHLAHCALRTLEPALASVLDEHGRPIESVPDELSDVVLQVLSVAVLRKDRALPGCEPGRAHLAQPQSTAILAMMVAAGQLIEELMMNEGYRHIRPTRGGEDLIRNRSSFLLAICESLAAEEGFDLLTAFNTMAAEAEEFARKRHEHPHEL